MKRKFGNRQGWGRIGHQQYTQHYLNNDIFKGYVCLIRFDKVLHPLWSSYTKKKICLVEDGSYMLQQYPEGKHYSMISYFSPEGTLLQWYIDITYSTGVEDGIPYMDDLYLDLIVVPDGEVIEKDLDELEQALSVAHRAYVLETGKIVLAGSAKELQESDEVKAAYLGGL